MICPEFEADIALYAGGDLPAARIAPLETHLAECADCRVLAEELRAGQALLRELREEPVEDAMVAQVRRRVLAQIGAARPSRLYWKLALAAALILAVIFVWPRHQARIGPAAPMAHVEPAPVAPARRPNIIPVRHGVIRRHHRRAPAAQPGPPVLVKFVTDDPNIVVYWLIDQKQGD